MRNNLVTFGLMVAAALIGAGAGHYLASRATYTLVHQLESLHREESQQRGNQAFSRGMEYQREIDAQCQLRDAQEKKCWIPCAVDEDCLAKNGMVQH